VTTALAHIVKQSAVADALLTSLQLLTRLYQQSVVRGDNVVHTRNTAACQLLHKLKNDRD
jgi:hypothetical protein